MHYWSCHQYLYSILIINNSFKVFFQAQYSISNCWSLRQAETASSFPYLQASRWFSKAVTFNPSSFCNLVRSDRFIEDLNLRFQQSEARFPCDLVAVYSTRIYEILQRNHARNFYCFRKSLKFSGAQPASYTRLWWPASIAIKAAPCPVYMHMSLWCYAANTPSHTVKHILLNTSVPLPFIQYIIPALNASRMQYKCQLSSFLHKNVWENWDWSHSSQWTCTRKKNLSRLEIQHQRGFYWAEYSQVQNFCFSLLLGRWWSGEERPMRLWSSRRLTVKNGGFSWLGKCLSFLPVKVCCSWNHSGNSPYQNLLNPVL